MILKVLGREEEYNIMKMLFFATAVQAELQLFVSTTISNCVEIKTLLSFRKYPDSSIYDGCMSILLANGTVVSQNAGGKE